MPDDQLTEPPSPAPAPIEREHIGALRLGPRRDLVLLIARRSGTVWLELNFRTLEPGGARLQYQAGARVFLSEIDTLIALLVKGRARLAAEAFWRPQGGTP